MNLVEDFDRLAGSQQYEAQYEAYERPPAQGLLDGADLPGVPSTSGPMLSLESTIRQASR